VSENYDILSDVVQDRAASTSDPVLNLTTGVSFTAEIETGLDPFTLPETIANDPRDKVRLHVTSDDEAKKLSKGDFIRFTLGGITTKMQIVSGYRSPTGIQSQLIAIQKAEKDA
jgi:hypothetical protein